MVMGKGTNEQVTMMMSLFMVVVAFLAISAIGQQPQMNPCYNAYNTFIAGCRAANTTAGALTCCRTMVDMAASNRPCLCEIFGLANLTNQQVISGLNNECGASIPGPTMCSNLPAGKLTMADLEFDPKSLVDALPH